MTDAYQKLCAGLTTLKMDAMRMALDNTIDRVNEGELNFVDGLATLVQRQVEDSKRRRIDSVIATAHFPAKKSFNDFDFGFQPELNKAEVMDLDNLRFMEDGSNVLFVGMPGVGKTHLAIATGMSAAKSGKTVYFLSCHELLENLKKAKAENRLEYRLRHYYSYSLLIIDEVGYLPIDPESANLLFELIARRYEVKSTIITTNKPLSKWGEMFGDAMVANAMLDRLLHHSKVFTITGPSFRTKDYKMDNRSIPLTSADVKGKEK